MINKKISVGSTLGQRGLALRANYNVSTIRRHGNEFKVFVNGDKVAWRETWKRVDYSNGRLAHYVLMEIEA